MKRWGVALQLIVCLALMSGCKLVLSNRPYGAEASVEAVTQEVQTEATPDRNVPTRATGAPTPTASSVTSPAPTPESSVPDSSDTVVAETSAPDDADAASATGRMARPIITPSDTSPDSAPDRPTRDASVVIGNTPAATPSPAPTMRVDSWPWQPPSPPPMTPAEIPSLSLVPSPSPIASVDTPLPIRSSPSPVESITTPNRMADVSPATALPPATPAVPQADSPPATPSVPQADSPAAPTLVAPTPTALTPPPTPDMGPVPESPTPSADLRQTPAEAPTVRETTITINTADYQSALTATAADDPVYPYPRLNHELVGPPSPKSYRAIVLENSYLQLTILPDLGGRIYRWVDKASGKNLFYENPVVMPTSWGNRGWWLATGGMEWALPVDEHGLSEANPWNYTIQRGTDSASVTLSDVEERSGLLSEITVKVDATHSYFTLTPKITNPGSSKTNYKFWINGMFALGSSQAGPGLKFVLPGNQVTVHSTGDTSLPQPKEQMDWPLYRGRDFSSYQSWQSYLGIFAAPSAQEGYMGAYDHRTNLGVVRVFPNKVVHGAKIFAPGDLDPARWTVDGSSYFELWGGLAPTFWDETSLEAGQSVAWQEQWYAIGDMGGFNYANADAALSLGTTNDTVQVAAASTRPIDANLILWRGEDSTEATRWPIWLAPETPFRGSFKPSSGAAGPWGLSLVDKDGHTVASMGRIGDGSGGNSDGSIPGTDQVLVIDRKGQQQDWDWVEEEFGYQLMRAPMRSANGRVFRLVKLQEAEAGPTYVVEVRNGKGGPLSDYLVAQYYPGAPNEILQFANQQWHGFDRAVFGYPGANGNWGVGFGLEGQNAPGEGQSAFFLLSSEVPSDVLARVGPLADTNYRVLRPTFKMVGEGPSAVAAEDALAWDPRLDVVGVEVERAEPEPGKPYYRLVAARFRDPAESQALHHVYVEVLDGGGRRIVGQPVILAWDDGQSTMITENKPAPEYAANAPLYNYLGSYRVYVDGGTSDVVTGLGLPGKIHVTYLLTFERVDSDDSDETDATS